MSLTALVVSVVIAIFLVAFFMYFRGIWSYRKEVMYYLGTNMADCFNEDVVNEFYYNGFTAFECASDLVSRCDHG